MVYCLQGHFLQETANEALVRPNVATETANVHVINRMSREIIRRLVGLSAQFHLESIRALVAYIECRTVLCKLNIVRLQNAYDINQCVQSLRSISAQTAASGFVVVVCI